MTNPFLCSHSAICLYWIQKGRWFPFLRSEPISAFSFVSELLIGHRLTLISESSVLKLSPGTFTTSSCNVYIRDVTTDEFHWNSSKSFVYNGPLSFISSSVFFVSCVLWGENLRICPEWQFTRYSKSQVAGDYAEIPSYFQLICWVLFTSQKFEPLSLTMATQPDTSSANFICKSLLAGGNYFLFTGYLLQFTYNFNGHSQ